jgi:hypothetical protein
MRTRSAVALAGLAIGSIVATAVPGVAHTSANWTDSEWANGSIAASSFGCGTGTDYATAASGRFLSGGVLGIPLDSIAELAAVTANRSGADPAGFSPAGAAHVPGGAYQDSYLNPLDVTALGAIGIDLSGFTLGLPVGSAGALGQYARVSSHGYSAGASGLLTNDGGVGVTPSTPDGELPQPAIIGLSTLLPVTSGIADVALEIGAVAASSVLDWCAELENRSWGDGTLDGSERDYGIAGLDLAVDSPLAAALIPRVQTAIGAVATALVGLQGASGGIASAIGTTLNGVGGILAGLDLGGASGTVVLAGLDLAAVNGLLSGPGAVLGDGVVSLDLTDPGGTIRVDLAELLGGPDQLNNLSPNTELVINAAVINDILLRVGALVQAWVDDVADALLSAIADVSLDVDLTTNVGISSLGINILSVRTELTTTLGELMTPDSTPPVVSVSATALDLGLLGSVVAGALATLGLGSLGSLVTGINSSATLPAQILSSVTSAISSNLVSVVGSLVTGLATIATQLVTALGAVVNPLPTVLSVMVNVQPDLPGAPPGSGFTPGSPPLTSPQYLVTALRIGLLDGVAGSPAYLNLATASAGPNALLP